MRLDALGLLAEEPGGVNDFFKLPARRLGQRFGGFEPLEDDGRDLVHRFVGRLGRENRGYQELQGVSVFKGGVGVGVQLAQSRHDPAGAPLSIIKRLAGCRPGLRIHQEARAFGTGQPCGIFTDISMPLPTGTSQE
jgi:hypothetical protein